MIYERIQEYCRNEKLTLSEFEKKCQIGNGTIGKWKDDKMQPTIKTLSKIAHYTGITIGYWIGGIN